MRTGRTFHQKTELLGKTGVVGYNQKSSPDSPFRMHLSMIAIPALDALGPEPRAESPQVFTDRS